jgi:predicted esterase
MRAWRFRLFTLLQIPMSTRSSFFARLGLPLLIAGLLLTGCDLTSSEDDTIGGVNVTELFAPPTEAERQDVLLDWDRRDVSVQQFIGGDFCDAGEDLGFTVELVRHTVDGNVHRGAFLIPTDVEGRLPVVVYNHGGDQGVSIDDEVLPFLEALGERAQDFMYVVPSYRSESLRCSGFSSTSEGAPSPWDGDVDDALSLLNAALENVSTADGTRIGVIGFSRGAAVANLMAIRDERISQTISFFGPTDFYGPFARQVVESTLRGATPQLPGVDVLMERFILPLQEGELTIEDVRPELTRRSTAAFAGRLPAVQVHHGVDDPVVPTNEARLLDEALAAAGRSAEQGSAYELFIYDANPPYETPLAQHDPAALPESLARTGAFLERLLVPQQALTP